MRRLVKSIRHPMFTKGMPVLAFLAVAGCHRGTPSSLVVPLAYSPTNTADLAVLSNRIPPTAKIYVAPIVDSRPDTAIGANKENQVPVPIYGGSPPTPFIRDAIITGLRNIGVTVVNAPSADAYTLKLDLLRFWVDESTSYRGTITARARLLGKRGAVQWEGAVTGTNGRFGRSLSVGNYQETFSDSVISLLGQLLGNDAFVAQFKKS